MQKLPKMTKIGKFKCDILSNSLASFVTYKALNSAKRCNDWTPKKI